MSEDQSIAAISCVCALILVGGAILRRRMDPRSTLGLIAIWVAMILAGVALARLWIAHNS